MGRLNERLARFMSGRYGTDHLNKALMFAYFVLLVVNGFVKYSLLNGLLMAIAVYAIYRSLSRDLDKRRLENERYLRLSKPARRWLSLSARRLRGVRTFRYRVCPGCKATIEMPIRKGSRVIDCPRCHTEFETRIYL
ncbi:MAG: hypothetical protein CVV47_14820 [Spirochaetae bacterium HGW-Spirochaetae-3]|jgi:hypothetical protein|nr:MAG: hypothetical protein CVV47_14820 [Spirochaetae bacterium HGW-Spirochaetae-3]